MAVDLFSTSSGQFIAILSASHCRWFVVSQSPWCGALSLSGQSMLQILATPGIFPQNVCSSHAPEDELRNPERRLCPWTETCRFYLEWHPLTLGYLFLISMDAFREWSKCHNDVDVRKTKVKVVPVSESHNWSKLCLYPRLFTDLQSCQISIALD